MAGHNVLATKGSKLGPKGRDGLAVASHLQHDVCSRQQVLPHPQALHIQVVVYAAKAAAARARA